jgi:YhcH/YjgK/YiaL family protein
VPIDRVTARDYDADRDMLRLSGTGDFLTFGAGQFMILWPGDAHMPGIDAGVPGPVRKVVVKIAIESRVPNSVGP